LPILSSISNICKNCEGNGYTIEIESECCMNCNIDGSCCNIPKQIQVQVQCECISKESGAVELPKEDVDKFEKF